MAELTSKFNRDDIDTLIEAMDDWENVSNQEFNILKMIEAAPMPPKDHEAYEYLQQIKNVFRERRKEVADRREASQEKAIFLKAKLLMVRREFNINEVFEMAAEEAGVPPVASKYPVPDSIPPQSELLNDGEQKFRVIVQKKLDDAEYFIKDLGVWDHYQKYLSEKG